MRLERVGILTEKLSSRSSILRWRLCGELYRAQGHRSEKQDNEGQGQPEKDRMPLSEGAAVGTILVVRIGFLGSCVGLSRMGLWRIQGGIIILWGNQGGIAVVEHVAAHARCLIAETPFQHLQAHRDKLDGRVVSILNTDRPLRRSIEYR